MYYEIILLQVGYGSWMDPGCRPGSLSGILLLTVLQFHCFCINETHPLKAETTHSHLQTKLEEGF